MRWEAETERTLALFDADGNVRRHVAREGAYLGSGDEVVYGVTGGLVDTKHPTLETAKRAAEASL